MKIKSSTIGLILSGFFILAFGYATHATYDPIYAIIWAGVTVICGLFYWVFIVLSEIQDKLRGNKYVSTR